MITANWEAGDDDTWTVPMGGGFGRLIRIGKLPINLQVQAFHAVEKPDDDPTADWTLASRSSCCSRNESMANAEGEKDQ